MNNSPMILARYLLFALRDVQTKYAAAMKPADRRWLKETIAEAEAAMPNANGRPRTVDVDEARRMRDDGKTLAEIAERFGVTRQAVGAALKK